MKTSILLFTLVSTGFIFGGSNLDIMFGYPDHKCYRPTKPFSSSKYDWEMYTNDIESMHDCINNYIENAKNDIERIREKTKKAAADYNKVVDEAQSPY